jgi:thiamine biosynthesis lipoprotein
VDPLHGKAFRVEHVMGMPFSIDIRDGSAHDDPNRTEGVLDRCFETLRAADSTFSLWQPDTPMSRLSAGTARLGDMPTEVVEVLRACVRASVATGGAFRARRPDGRVDPTGLVKGWAVARVGRLLSSAGLRHWCVNAAGDVLVHGQARPGEPWVVGVINPDRPGELVDAVRLTHGAMATSGTAERGAHLWNPLPHNGSTNVRSVSVVARDIVRADVLATAASAYGDEAASWLESLTGVEGLVVRDDGQVDVTSGWAARTERIEEAPG